jgi:hypothetical protein
MCHVSGTGFSREEAGGHTLDFAVRHLTHSRLKPVAQWTSAVSVGPASAGKIADKIRGRAPLPRSTADYYVAGDAPVHGKPMRAVGPLAQ